MRLDKDEKPHLEVHDDNIGVGEVINASGHKQELERQFSLLSISSIGITTGNIWAALGGSIVSSLLSQHCNHSMHYMTARGFNDARLLRFTMAVHLALSMPLSLYRASTL